MNRYNRYNRIKRKNRLINAFSIALALPFFALALFTAIGLLGNVANSTSIGTSVSATKVIHNDVFFDDKGSLVIVSHAPKYKYKRVY